MQFVQRVKYRQSPLAPNRNRARRVRLSLITADAVIPVSVITSRVAPEAISTQAGKRFGTQAPATPAAGSEIATRSPSQAKIRCELRVGCRQVRRRDVFGYISVINGRPCCPSRKLLPQTQILRFSRENQVCWRRSPGWRQTGNDNRAALRSGAAACQQDQREGKRSKRSATHTFMLGGIVRLRSRLSITLAHPDK